MRTILPVGGGADGGESRGLRSRVGRMKRLLWLRPSQRADVHMDTEPGVWLTSFQLFDIDGQDKVSRNKTAQGFCDSGFQTIPRHPFCCISRFHQRVLTKFRSSDCFLESMPAVKMLHVRIMQIGLSHLQTEFIIQTQIKYIGMVI